MDDRVMMGRAIRAAREQAGLSIAAAARMALLTRSSLQRVEVGAAAVTEEDVARLDTVLHAEGELEEIYAAQRSVPHPPLHSFHRSVYEAGHRWPARWAGVVWVSVDTLELKDPAPLEISLRWGPWCFDIALLDNEILFEDFKVPDDVSVPIRVATSRPTDIGFGTGGRPESEVKFMNLRNRWERDT